MAKLTDTRYSILIGLVKGLNEVLKALDRKQALVAVLAADCEDAKYKKFVTVSVQSTALVVSAEMTVLTV